MNNEEKNTTGTREKKKRSTVWAVVIAVVLILAIIGGVVFIARDNGSTSTAPATSSSDGIKIGESKSYNEKGADGTLTSVEIAEKVKPSVIGVTITQSGQEYGEGSGVVMSVNKETGMSYVVTCAHMVNESGLSVQVALEDGTSYDATVVGYDNRTDIAVLAVKTTDLTPAEFGDSTVLKVGEPVYAIGNPGGSQFYGSMTSGIVSAIDRPTASSESGYTMECIQHDAAINPGNSGGALVNSYGQVIGINSSKIASEDFEGMGFAVPTSVVQKTVDSILKNGYVAGRAKLGIQYVPCSSEESYNRVLQVNNLPAGSLAIAEIGSDSSFTGTQVKQGDIIIAVNGKDLTSTDQLVKTIEKSKPGDKLKLKIGRVGSDYKVTTFDVEVTLKEDRGTSASSSSQSSNTPFQNPFAGGSGSQNRTR